MRAGVEIVDGGRIIGKVRETKKRSSNNIVFSVWYWMSGAIMDHIDHVCSTGCMQVNVLNV
jgi:hypothetical protein